MNDTSHDFNPEMYQQIFDTVPVGLMIVNKNKEIEAWNSWLEDKTTLKKEDTRYKKLSDLYKEKDFSRFNWALEQVMDFGSPQVLSQALNQYLVPIALIETHYKDIDYMQQHVEIHPLFNEDTSFALVIISDVTSKFYEKTDLLNLAKKFSADSIHDALTGIYNRRYLWEWLEQAINKARRKNQIIACSMYDIDHFKEINDTYGHKIGDTYIKRFVETVKNVIRAGDVFIRYGGDEFITISFLKNGTDTAIKLPKRVIKNFFEPKNNDNEFQISCSCGISVWSKEHNAVSPKSLVQQADKALYMAKKAGRNCSWLYTSDISKEDSGFCP